MQCARDPADFILYLIESTNTSMPLYKQGMTSTRAYRVRYTVPRTLIVKCPLPKMPMKLKGLFVAVTASSLVCAISHLLMQIAIQSLQSFSRIVIKAFTCRHDILNSDPVILKSLGMPVNISLANSTLSLLWTDLAILLIWTG